MLSKSDYKYYEKAKIAADLSDYKKTHIGCIAVYQGNVIGIGCNTIKTHPIQKYYGSRVASFFSLPSTSTVILSVSIIPAIFIEVCLVSLKTKFAIIL